MVIPPRAFSSAATSAGVGVRMARFWPSAGMARFWPSAGMAGFAPAAGVARSWLAEGAARFWLEGWPARPWLAGRTAWAWSEPAVAGGQNVSAPDVGVLEVMRTPSVR